MTAELLFQSQEKLEDGSLVITMKVSGGVDDDVIRQFENIFMGFLKQGVTKFILHFSDVKYINSCILGLFIKVADICQERGGDAKLVGVPEKIIALFEMLNLLSLFKMYKTEQDAMSAFREMIN